ncbi:DUF4350 domain-containing protein [Sphingobacterium sp. SYP-B4668]|uniref:DUF4350 domain-containing protein n=1 Tax=Sphingobacterium sp. SYP-B4668 TaxID=2996035 RepID=UPI0022DE5122|nr:DUF4350 domain-containing protein [Sphingobacterium sp. SYP-B4668]
MIRQALYRLLILWAMLVLCTSKGLAQQVADENFHYSIPAPMYAASSGPLIIFDEAHHNASTLRGAYSPFAKLLRSDGYQVVSSKEPVSSGLLKEATIYVTVNAMYDLEDWNLPARSAFSADEIELLVKWVADGGSLFLVTDHMPCGASVQKLAARFGFNIINGFALRKDGMPEIFSKERNTLLSNDITSPAGQEIDSIMCWGGTGFIAPSDAQVISVLGDDYNIYLPSDVAQIKKPLPDTLPYISGRGLVNGAYLHFGKGRIVIFGDGAPFSAQLQGIKSAKRGMNHPSAMQHAPFLLHIIHWLDRKL